MYTQALLFGSACDEQLCMLTNGMFTRQTRILGVEIREVPEDHASYGRGATVNYTGCAPRASRDCPVASGQH